MPTSPQAATDPARLPACSRSPPRRRSWTRSQPRSRSGPATNAPGDDRLCEAREVSREPLLRPGRDRPQHLQPHEAGSHDAAGRVAHAARVLVARAAPRHRGPARQSSLRPPEVHREQTDDRSGGAERGACWLDDPVPGRARAGAQRRGPALPEASALRGPACDRHGQRHGLVSPGEQPGEERPRRPRRRSRPNPQRSRSATPPRSLEVRHRPDESSCPGINDHSKLRSRRRDQSLDGIVSQSRPAAACDGAAPGAHRSALAAVLGLADRSAASPPAGTFTRLSRP
jgi:hypothetical protein